MKYDIKEVSSRLRATRESLEISTKDMAAAARITEQEYIAYETGEKDLSLSVLNSCAEAMGIEMIELLTGSSPTLATYSLVRKGEGLPIERRIGFTYQHSSRTRRSSLSWYTRPMSLTRASLSQCRCMRDRKWTSSSKEK